MAENGSEEREPLLQNDHSSINQNVQQTMISLVNFDKEPFSHEQFLDGDSVACKVCHSTIDISGYRVAKCGYCNESTPIKDAPRGKKYVRCPCNFLITCKATSQEITCPRPNCRRKSTNLSPVAIAVPTFSGMSRVICAYCQHRFLVYNVLKNMLAMCPHCNKNSSVRPKFTLFTAIINLIAGLFCLFIAVFITYVVLFTTNPGFDTIYIVVGFISSFVNFFLAFVRIYVAYYDYSRKVSVIEGPA